MTMATFTNSTGVSFPDPGTLIEIVTVSGLPTHISHLSVTINGLVHDSLGDIDLLLVAPDGTHNLLFWSDAGNGFSASTPITVTVDDGGGQLLPVNAPFASGAIYRPADYGQSENDADFSASTGGINHPVSNGSATFASAFDGIDPNGDWALSARDDFPGGTGQFSSWSLTIDTADLVIEGTPGSDVVVITATSPTSGSYTVNGGAPISFSGIASLAFNGLGGNDSIAVNGVLHLPGSSEYVAGAGADVMGGTSGDDTFIYYFGADGPAGESIDAGAGSDTLQLRNSAPDQFNLNLWTLHNLETLQFAGTAATLVVADGTQIGAGGIVNVIGSDAADKLNVFIDLHGTIDLSGVSFTNWNDSADVINITGTEGPDTLIGSSHDDVIKGNIDDDTIDGGPGIDRAVFSGNRADYTITSLNDGSTEVDGGDGHDVLTNVEFLVFDDQTIATNSPPTITSNGGGDTAAIAVSENTTAVTTVMASDPDSGTVLSYAIVGGADQARFQIDAASGALSFIAPPDYEAPGDANADNRYVVQVQASDGTLSDTQTLTVRVDDVAPVISGDNGDNVLTGTAENDTIQGLLGDDTAVFSHPLASYALQDLGSRITVAGPDGNDTLTGIEHLRFTDGTIDVIDGNGVFDTVFYDRSYLDVFHAGANALAHYNASGWHEGRDPNAFFSTSGYLGANHDVAAAGVNPLLHYHQSGWREGRDPSASFDTTLYLLHNPDVAAAHVDPLEHYLQSGRSEGRAAYAAVGGSIVGGFDAEYYLLANPDVVRAGVDPLLHFNTMGWREGRNPNAFFDTAGYLAHYSDVAAAGVNPLLHYEQSGWKEGRDPSASFDTLGYLAANPDVAAAHVNPLDHYLISGIYEGRAIVNDGTWF